MELSEIQEGILAIPRKYSPQVILAAMDNEEAITPWLLDVLETAVKNAEQGIVNDEEMSSFVALFLLSKFRNTQAFPLVLRISQLPPEDLDDYIGDGVTEDLPRFLASTYDGDANKLYAVCRNRKADEWARHAAIHAMLILAFEGEVEIREIEFFLKSLFDSGVENLPDALICAIVDCAADLQIESLRPYILKAYEAGLIDSFFCPIDEFNELMSMNPTDRKHARFSEYNKFIEDPLAEVGKYMKYYASGKQEYQHKMAEMALAPLNRTKNSEPASAIHIGNMANKPCHCGSGKKLKKCCGRTNA